MVLRTFNYGDPNVSATIIKEDKTNVDTMTINVNFGTAGEVGDEIEFYDENAVLAFAGYIESKETAGQLTFECEDWGSILKRTVTNTIFTDQRAEEIIQTVVESVGLTYVSSITTTEVISTYVCDKKNNLEIVEELADKLLANFMTDVNKNFMLETEGGNLSSKAITNSNGLLDGSWETDITELINAVYVEGDDRNVFGTQDTFSGDNSTTEFTLTEIPVDITVTVNGTILQGFVDGQSTGDYQIQREQKKVIFNVAPSAGVDNIVVDYTFSIPVTIRRRNASSIATYGERNSIIRKNWIETREDARNYANYIITNFSQPLVNSTWSITLQADINDWQSFLPNEQLSVTDSLQGFAGNYIIRKVERRYGTGTALKVTVGSKERNLALYDKQVTDRIRQLETSDQNQSILNEDEYIEETLNIQLRSEVITFQRQGSTNTFIVGESEVGGDDVIGGINPFVINESIINGSNLTNGQLPFAFDEDTWDGGGSYDFVDNWITISPSKFPLSLPFSLE